MSTKKAKDHNSSHRSGGGNAKPLDSSLAEKALSLLRQVQEAQIDDHRSAADQTRSLRVEKEDLDIDLASSQEFSFRSYLEDSGVIDWLTSVLVELFEAEDKPENPLRFLQTRLAGLQQLGENTDIINMDELQVENCALRQQNEDLRDQLQRTKAQNEVLAGRIAPAPSDGAGGPFGGTASSSTGKSKSKR